MLSDDRPGNGARRRSQGRCRCASQQQNLVEYLKSL